jgi:hypothetical protein
MEIWEKMSLLASATPMVNLPSMSKITVADFLPLVSTTPEGEMALWGTMQGEMIHERNLKKNLVRLFQGKRKRNLSLP